MLENSKSKTAQALKNKEEISGNLLNPGETVKVTQNDEGNVVLEEQGIEAYYQTIEKDLFAKWDRLEQKKSEIRNKIQELEEGPVPDFFNDLIIELLDTYIEAIEEYQGKLETTQEVLEFEEEQHSDGIR